jgi:type III restriction enzyme
LTVGLALKKVGLADQVVDLQTSLIDVGRLAGQVVQHLRGYLPDEPAVLNVLQYHQQALVNLIHAQMQEHYFEEATEYEAQVSRGFRTMRPSNYSSTESEQARNFRNLVEERLLIRGMFFTGFAKCLYDAQKFDSDTERRFAVILENDAEVEKWFKPSKGDFQIHFSNDAEYEPDFVVETKKFRYLCEPKGGWGITDETVEQKAKAAALWCQYATAHGASRGSTC